jgi:hypothetical protein
VLIVVNTGFYVMRDELLVCAEMDGGNLLRVLQLTSHKFNIIIVNKLRCTVTMF